MAFIMDLQEHLLLQMLKWDSVYTDGNVLVY